ncbi:MAG TPA: hypothetical protein PK743_03030 [Luteimonas sp.]|nr:hypothetical protein [Luteimonas sp.]HRO25851.1 hypothetical protein [Luteimonas sp.]HRP71595.1 hypothetical protein [Luteimonas sp.]
MNAIPQTFSPQASFHPNPSSCAPRPLPVSERRERDFGIGYGNSSGYASDRRYAPATSAARFRFA